jgi:hypothetical protein
VKWAYFLQAEHPYTKGCVAPSRLTAPSWAAVEPPAEPRQQCLTSKRPLTGHPRPGMTLWPCELPYGGTVTYDAEVTHDVAVTHDGGITHDGVMNYDGRFFSSA